MTNDKLSEAPPKMGQYEVIDAFCGAGGLSLGFIRAGFHVIYAFDNNKTAIETYRRNIGRHGYVADAYQISKKSVEKALGKSIGNIGGVIGGPPCQGLSVQRRGSDFDQRNHLLLEFIRLVLEIKPKFFLMENVGGILSKRGAPFLYQIKYQCEQASYKLHIGKLNAFDFGVPQIRKRVFIVGENGDVALNKFCFPESTRNKGQYPATVREAIEDLVIKDEGEISNHFADRLSIVNKERIRSIQEGEGRESLPEHLILPCHRKNTNHRHLDTYGRMAWDLPSPTITARFDSFSRGRFGHPQLDRTITLREGARLQSFPDEFFFSGSKVEVAAQIGNAVPPLLAQAIASQIRRLL
jgi:DNA (cytosine-5)-methyltransferase 1